METQFSSRFRSVALFAFATIALATLAGCPAERPPIEPDWPQRQVDPDDRTAPIATTPDVSSLRPIVEQQRERLRVLIDLAERREINDGGPHLLKAAKSQAQVLDQIEAHLNDAMRTGANDEEVDSIHEDLRRFASRLSLLAESLQ